MLSKIFNYEWKSAEDSKIVRGVCILLVPISMQHLRDLFEGVLNSNIFKSGLVKEVLVYYDNRYLAEAFDNFCRLTGCVGVTRDTLEDNINLVSSTIFMLGDRSRIEDIDSIDSINSLITFSENVVEVPSVYSVQLNHPEVNSATDFIVEVFGNTAANLNFTKLIITINKTTRLLNNELISEKLQENTKLFFYIESMIHRLHQKKKDGLFYYTITISGSPDKRLFYNKLDSCIYSSDHVQRILDYLFIERQFKRSFYGEY